MAAETQHLPGKVMRAPHMATVVLAMLLGAGLAAAQAQSLPPTYETVDIPVAGPRATTLKAHIRRPVTTSPVPAIVGLHGCGGLFTASGKLSAREAAWAELLVSDGYAVLFPDSFNPRGFREICTIALRDRPILPIHRTADAAAALAWLASQPFIDAARMALLGWSHGGSTTLLAIDQARKAPLAPLPKLAIAFYPGCRPAAERSGYAPAVPLTILIGSADDWTPPAPCRSLADKHPIRLLEYPGAVHGFDAPNVPLRTRMDVAAPAPGQKGVQVGTDPVARAAAIAEVRAMLAASLGAPSTSR